MTKVWQDVVSKSKYYNSDVYGVEIELENLTGYDQDTSILPTTMRLKGDSSLKAPDSYELYMRYPKEEAVTADSLRKTHAALEPYLKPQTDRAGIHVHSNMLHLTYPEIRTVICVFLLAENMIFDLLPDNRRRSIFCCPISKSWRQQQAVHAYAAYLRSIMEKEVNLSYTHPFWRIYSDTFNSKKTYHSIHLASMFNFGSIELRMFNSSENLDDWLFALHMTSTLHQSYKHGTCADMDTPAKAHDFIVKLFKEALGEADFLYDEGTLMKSIMTAWPYTSLIINEHYLNPNRTQVQSQLIPKNAQDLNACNQVIAEYLKGVA